MFETLTVQVGMESEGFAIYDAMMQLKNEVIPSYYSCILLVMFSILVAVMVLCALVVWSYIGMFLD